MTEDTPKIKAKESKGLVLRQVTAQQDPKKFVWFSPDKAGTEPQYDLAHTIAEFSQTYAIGDWQRTYEKAKDLCNATGRPLIYVTPDKQYFDEEGNPVILFDEFGDTTELGANAVVIPVKPDGNEL